MAKQSDGVSSLTRGFELLAAFDVDEPVLTLTQISQRSGIPLSTAHRLVRILVENKVLVRQGRGRYSLGLRLWELGSRASMAQILREIALPFLHQVQARIGQHTQLGILAEGEVIFLERLSAPQSVINYTMVGGRLPLNASSSGLLLLAMTSDEDRSNLLTEAQKYFQYYTKWTPRADEIEARIMQVRKQEYVVAEGWIHPRATGIAVPIRDSLGVMIASLSVVVPNDGRARTPLVQLLRETASRISAALARSDSYVMDKRTISQLAGRVRLVE